MTAVLQWADEPDGQASESDTLPQPQPPVRVFIRKFSGQVVEFARRSTLKQAREDVRGLRYWSIDAFVEGEGEVPA